MNVAFLTLGCKVNHYETQAMQELFVSAGYTVVPFDERADIYVVNTCTVTQMSDKKSRQMLHRAHLRNPGSLVVAVGCYAETDADAIRAMDGVGLVIGTDGRRDIVARCEAALSAVSCAPQTNTPPLSRRTFEELSATRDGRTRAVLKIEDGCANFCSYCIIPYARGAVRSRPLSGCKEELLALAAAGYREVVLTGIQLSAYGRDLPEPADLCDVTRIAAAIDGIDRIRLGSLEPLSVDGRFLDTVAGTDKLCGQFHLSMQSGSDSVLARMNRRYTSAQYREAAASLRRVRPDCAITTDVIAGFVGETEEEHAQTLAFVEEMGFARIHVFPYSRRRGTKADAMSGHLPRAVKERRTRELIALGDRLEAAFVDRQIGKRVSVLMESDGTGYTGNYVRVRCQGREGDWIETTIVGRDGALAIGQ